MKKIISFLLNRKIDIKDSSFGEIRNGITRRSVILALQKGKQK